ncbi:MAG: cellulase family glycosylhydrolase [bacterium]|nr:cellulase family glycosylhydrolase [bacterium]
MKNLVFTILICSFFGCGESVSDLIDDVVNEPDRKPIDTSILGTNAFFNDTRFGSIGSQANEVKNTLALNYVRVLFAWNDQVQPSPNVTPNFSFYDDIASKVAARDLQMLVVVTGVPSWMSNNANWSIDGNSRKTFAELWLRKVVERYSSNGRVTAFQIWNEPNMVSDPNNSTLGFASNPSNYLELLCYGYSVIKDIAPSKLVVSAATTAINQNFPESINYNKDFYTAGAASCLDVYAVHVYGKQFENFVRSGGVTDFLNGVARPIWVTESGSQGFDTQLAYGEQMWPYLQSKIPGIARIYQYQFVEATSAQTTYGLRNLTPGSELSDLYVSLRDR